MDGPGSGPVLAGVDGSPGTAEAAHTAAAEARCRRLPLRLLISAPHGPAHPVRRPPDKIRQGVDLTVRHVRETWPLLEVVPAAAGHELAHALVEQSRDATLLVAAAGHLGGYDNLLGRWLGNRVVTHAHCPVLVVRGEASAVARGVGNRPVLIGLDGSEHCAAAMPLAVEAALLRGVPLRVVSVHCVGPPATAGTGDYSTSGNYSASTAHARATDLITEALEGWADRYPRLEVIRQPMYAPDVASALVAASDTADLVVVGCRGRSTITSLALGSVSQALVERARCPVLVARARDNGWAGAATVGRAPARLVRRPAASLDQVTVSGAPANQRR